MKVIGFFILSFLVACGAGSSTEQLTFYEVQNESFNQLINTKSMPENPNASVDKFIINNKYPIELALYSDGKFYYNLPTLGDGTGTWTQETGYVKLYAERSLFDMYIEIKAIDENAQEFGIFFVDRFGPQSIKVDKLNFPNLKSGDITP